MPSALFGSWRLLGPEALKWVRQEPDRQSAWLFLKLMPVATHAPAGLGVLFLAKLGGVGTDSLPGLPLLTRYLKWAYCRWVPCLFVWAVHEAAPPLPPEASGVAPLGAGGGVSPLPPPP